VLANVLSKAAGQEPREFESQEAAQAWLTRQLDRWPARLVNPALALIEQLAAA
jgi:hypothetical protein